MRRYPSRCSGAPRALAVLLGILWVPGVAAQGKIQLSLQNAPVTILKNSTTTRNIVGIPDDTPGLIQLRVKWHVMTLIPNVFNKLKVEILHGSTVKKTYTCYSVHSDKEPRCFMSESVDQTEAGSSANWKLRVTNSTNDDVNGFNIRKEGTDLNPTVMNVESTFEPVCSSRQVTLQGAPLPIPPNSTTERELFGILSQPGEVRIRGKWHTDVVAPNSFRRLKIEVLRGGSVAAVQYGYSIHSNESNKLDLRFNVSAGQAGPWKLRISNEEPFNHKSFDIEKGSDINPIMSKTDLNPFVPQFISTYKPSCS